MFKIGDKVVIKESGRYSFPSPYDGVVESCSSSSSYLVKFSDGRRFSVFEEFLEADTKFKVGDSVQIKPQYQEALRAPYDGVVTECSTVFGKYRIKFSDGQPGFMSEHILELLPSPDFEELAELLRNNGYLVEKL